VTVDGVERATASQAAAFEKLYGPPGPQFLIAMQFESWLVSVTV
jgi:hypothetical protein